MTLFVITPVFKGIYIIFYNNMLGVNKKRPLILDNTCCVNPQVLQIKKNNTFIIKTSGHGNIAVCINVMTPIHKIRTCTHNTCI